jgi:hypothetical protein
MSRILAALIVLPSLVLPAAAQDLSGKAKEAETLAAVGKFMEALAALDEAADALWAKAPLSFRRALWVAEPPSGFGAYTPRNSDTFASGEKMIAYVEPIGFGWRRAGELWRTDLVTDLVIKSKDGAELLRKAEFNKLQIASRVHNREFMAHFTYTFTGIPKGEYIAETIVRDAVTGKSGTFALPFVVR